jgi:MFS transporter, DHA2 family, multidrug resistance protein
VTTATPAGRREWIALAVLLLPLLLVSMDVSVLYFAVPFISRDLAPTSAEQLWIFDIYGFVLAGLLITMGSVGDRIGRRRLLLLGASLFGLASLAAAFSSSPLMLIFARALLGIGGATLMPSTLALIRNIFHAEQERGTAVAIWTSGLTFGVALGPILSGFLLERFWWGSVFLINVPFMLMLLMLAPALVPEHRDAIAGRFDFGSSVLSLGSVLPAIYGIKELAAHGPTPVSLASVAVGIGVGVFFVRRQMVRAHPMIDLDLFRRRAFSGSIAMNVVAMFALVGMAIFTTQYLQSVLGLAPLEGALWSVVPTLGVGLAATLATLLVQRGMQRAYLMSLGFVLAAGGLVLITRVGIDSPLWLILVGAGLLGAGMVVVMSLGTELVMAAAPASRAGTASALLETGSEFGGALGIAVLGSIGTAVYRTSLSALRLPEPAEPIRETLGGALAVASQLPSPAAETVVLLARSAFIDSMHAAALAATIVAGLAAVSAVLVLRRATAEAEQPEQRSAALALRDVRQNGFDVENRRPIDGFEVAHLDA